MNERKAWEERSNEEKKLSYDAYVKNKIFEAHKTSKADWQKSMSKEEIDNSMPYNASNGKTYSRETSMLLRAEMAIKGYDKAQFLTMEQGNIMGGKLKLKTDENGEIQKTSSGKDARVDGVKVLIIKNFELIDKISSDGKPITSTFKDKNGKEHEYIVKEKIPIEPKMETITLYHVSQFDGIDQSKIKERDLSAINKFRENQQNEPYEIKVDYGKKYDIGGNLEKQLNALTIAQIKGVDYPNLVELKTKEVEQSQTKEQTKSKTSKKTKSKTQELGR